MIAEETGLDKSAVHRIPTSFAHVKNLCKTSAEKLVCGAKSEPVGICQDLLGRLEIEPHFLDKVITGDESWVFDYDPETKLQSAEWHTKSSPRPMKARMSRSRVKTMIIIFFRQPWHCAQRICTSRTDM